MALDPSIALQGTMTNPNAMVEGAQIQGMQQQQQQSAQLQPYKVLSAQQDTNQAAQLNPIAVQTAKLSALKQKMDLSLSLLATVVDPLSYKKAIDTAKTYGLDTSRFPDNYDPRVIQQAQYAGMTAAQRVNDQLRAANVAAIAGAKVGDPTQFMQPGSAGAQVLGLSSPRVPEAAPSVPTAPIQGSNTESVLPPPVVQQAVQANPNAAPVLPQNGLDPEQEFQQARAAQQQTLAQTGQLANNNSIPQKGPTETVQAFNARLKASGDVATNQIMDEAAQRGQPITRAQAIAIKDGRSSAMDTTGKVNPLPGAAESEATLSNAKDEGAQSVKISQDINDKAMAALQTKRTLTEMQNLAQNVNTGNFAPVLSKLGAWGVSLGIPEDTVQQYLNGVRPGNAQDLNKLTAVLAGQALKQFSNRGTQMEFSTMLAQNPNIALTPDGFNQMINFLQKNTDQPLAEQAAFMQWKQGKSPKDYQDFPAEWTQQQLKNISSTLPAAQPSTPNAAQGTTARQTPSSINPTSVARLKANPKEAPLFDQRYGQGAAAQILGNQ